MKICIQKFLSNEILAYLFFGLATTLVSILSRFVIYQLSHQELLATGLANIIGILFAFSTMIGLYLSKLGRIGQDVWWNFLLPAFLLFC